MSLWNTAGKTMTNYGYTIRIETVSGGFKPFRWFVIDTNTGSCIGTDDADTMGEAKAAAMRRAGWTPYETIATLEETKKRLKEEQERAESLVREVARLEEKLAAISNERVASVATELFGQVAMTMLAVEDGITKTKQQQVVMKKAAVEVVDAAIILNDELKSRNL